MNTLEALAAAKANDTVVRRQIWPEDQFIFWKDDVLCWNKPSVGVFEGRLEQFTVETMLATDWIEA